ncbi:hypothetical protein MHB77_30965 [Paenibacillus sp. FSL K6-3166]
MSKNLCIDFGCSIIEYSVVVMWMSIVRIAFKSGKGTMRFEDLAKF